MNKNIIIKILIKYSNKYIYCYIINNNNKKIITSLSTHNIKCNKKIYNTNNLKNSKILALNIAKYLKKLKIKQIIFDKNKKKYHGKLKMIAEIIKKYNIKI